MARGINKVILIGHLGADPETRAMPSGMTVANLRLATTESWQDKQSGEQQERTEWHHVALFGRLGEIAAEYLRKGSQVYIEGSLRTRKWQDKEGNDRYTTEIVGNEMQMLGGAAARGAVRQRQAARGGAARGPSGAGATSASRGRDAAELGPADAGAYARGVRRRHLRSERRWRRFSKLVDLCAIVAIAKLGRRRRALPARSRTAQNRYPLKPLNFPLCPAATSSRPSAAR